MLQKLSVWFQCNHCVVCKRCYEVLSVCPVCGSSPFPQGPPEMNCILEASPQWAERWAELVAEARHESLMGWLTICVHSS